MRNDEIAEIFAEIADMLELRNDNFYHKRAYRLAAEGVRDFPEPIKLLSRDQLQKIRKHEAKVRRERPTESR